MSTDDTIDENAHPYETEESFHPLGAEWESEMRDQLEETEFDADLGMRMARDAQRLVAGELTEKEFYAEYHDDVTDEFDVDERPIFDDVDLDAVDPDEFDSPDGGSMLTSLSDIDLEGDDHSRRDVMKKMGAGAAFLGYGAYASYDSNQEAPQSISGISPAEDAGDRDARWGMVIDLERCDGCLACVTGCVDENGTSTGANWMYVMPYENEDAGQQNFLVRPCQHCTNAPCAKVCPVRARHTRENDGLVLTNYETCIGCRYCQVACPYGVNYFQWGEPDVPIEEIDQIGLTPSEVQDLDEEERSQRLADAHDHVYDDRGWWVDSRPPQGVMGKCTMCPSRQDGHTEDHGPRGTVACMDACDAQGMSAIHFGDMDDPESRPNEYLSRRSENHFDEGATKFEADIGFTVNDEDEPIDVEAGSYPFHFIERRTDREDRPWRLFESHAIVVAEGSERAGADEFEESSIADLGGVPSDDTSVISPTESFDVEVDLVFDDDEFDDEAPEMDVDIELELVGAVTETLATETVTLSAEDDLDEDEGVIRRMLSLSVDELDFVPDDELYVLSLLVEEEDDDGAEFRVADYQRLFVSQTGNTERPEAPYGPSGLDGGLADVPDVVFLDSTTTVDATVAYPNVAGERIHDMRLVLDDETIETDADTGDTIAREVYEFEDTMTSNTPWSGKLSSFRLLEDLGTEPNIIYLGDEPGPNDEQNDGPVGYDDISTTRWGEWMEIKDNRKEHLDYGAGAHRQTGSAYQ